MKHSPLNKIGKIGRANLEANKRLRQIFTERGFDCCEIALAGCLRFFTLSFAHRHKRLWYKGDVEKLSDIKQVVLACIPCHQRIENDAKLTEEVFVKLRGEET